MTLSGTIIMPIAGRSSRFPGVRPKWMLTAPSGELMLQRSLESIDRWRDHQLVIGALREHLDDLQGMEALRRALGPHPQIVVFDEQTSGPAETVARVLQEAHVTGAFFIKDCDSWFTPSEDVFNDCVCYADLRALRDVRNVAGKSFLQLNENGIVTGIIEKSVSSNFISTGGYGFRDAEAYLRAYHTLMAAERRGEPFVSHVIVEAIRQGAAFKGVATSDYEDVGTLQAWQTFRKRQSVYFVDIDGVVFRNAGQYLPPLWESEDVPLPRNVAHLKALNDRGAQLVFVTARPERYRLKTEAALREAGLDWHGILFGVAHASRVLINDFADSNPFPSAVAVNVARNDDALDKVLRLDLD